MKTIFELFFLIISVATFIIVSFSKVPSGFEFLSLLPISMLLSYFLFLRRIAIKNGSIVVKMYLLISIIRYIVSPLIIVLSSTYYLLGMRYASYESVRIAIALMIYEVISCGFFVTLMFNKQDSFSKNLNQAAVGRLTGNQFVYILVIIISLGVFLFSIRYLKPSPVNFFLLPVGTDRLGLTNSLAYTLVRQIVATGLMVLFLVVASHASQLYKSTHKKRYILVAIFFALINVSIIISESRMTQLYVAAVSTFVLIRLFPKYKNRIFFLIGIVTFIVLFLMSLYKFNFAFTNTSYFDSLQTNLIGLEDTATILHSYFLGPQSIALVVDLKEYTYDNTLLRVPYDFLRSIFGLNFLFRDLMKTSSELYNSYVYGYSRVSGYILPAVGYGYFYLGFLLAPFFSCVNLWISLQIEKRFLHSRSLEMTYIWGYILARFLFSIFSFTPMLVNLASIVLGTSGLVYLIAKIVNSLKKGTDYAQQHNL